MATKFVLDIKGKTEEVVQLLGKYEGFVILLEKYVKDPMGTIKNIMVQNPDLKEEFTDVNSGLDGEFTRQTSINLGKEKLLKRIESLVEELISKDDILKEFITKPLDEIKSNLDIVDTNVNIPSLLERKNRYTRTDLERKFMSDKLLGLLTTELTNQNLNMSNSAFLTKLLNILAVVRSFDFNNAFNNINVYHNKNTSIVNNFKNIGQKGLFSPDINVRENKEFDTSSGEEFLQKSLREIEVENMEGTELDLFNRLLDDLEPTLTRLKDIQVKLEELLSKLTITSHNVASEYGPGIINVLNAYKTTELTNEEFFQKLKDSNITLINYYSVQSDLLVLLSNYITYIVNGIHVFNYVYGLCEQATIKGTIIDGKVGVSLSKK